MKRTEFFDAMREQGFTVDPQNEDCIIGRVEFVGPTLELTYDDDNRPSGIVETPRPEMQETPDLSFFLTPSEIDAAFHFSAAIIGDWGANEFVHVLEPGPYHDHVFLNIHDDGNLVTVEYLIDADDFDPSNLGCVYSDDAYEDVSKQTRLEWQPFFQNPVARSLAEFAKQIVVVKRK